MKIKIRNPFSRRKDKTVELSQKVKGGFSLFHRTDRPKVVEKDAGQNLQTQVVEREERKKSKEGKFKLGFSKREEPKVGKKPEPEKARSAFQVFAYNLLSKRIPGLEEFKESYGQSGLSLIYEAYVSTGFLLSLILTVPAFVASFLVEIVVFAHPEIFIALFGSVILSATVFGITLVVWLYYPVIRRRSFKSKLEGQLAYSFGILGVLAAGGMNLERLFERIAYSESNPVLADLAKRFLRDIRVFGLDTETALVEVAQHSPSEAFSKMLDSISVAHKTTGSIHDLVMFESARLLQDKRDRLRKTIGSLAVTAEMYITIVVVGPIIFIVMLAIFALLPNSNLPPPTELINLTVFIGIPVLSVMFILMLDSVVSKT